MAFLFRKQQKDNPTKTKIVKHDDKSGSENQVRWSADDPDGQRLAPPRPGFMGFDSPHGRF